MKMTVDAGYALAILYRARLNRDDGNKPAVDCWVPANGSSAFFGLFRRGLAERSKSEGTVFYRITHAGTAVGAATPWILKEARK